MPADDVTLSAEAAEVANRIEAIDAQVAEIEQRTKRILGLGMMGGRFPAHQAEDHLDEQRDALLRDRAALVVRLRALTGVG